MASIVMFAAGSSTVGIGHLSRTQTVAAELAKLTDVELVLEVDELMRSRLGSSTIPVTVTATRAESLAAVGRNVAPHTVVVTDATGFTSADRDAITELGARARIHLTDDAISEYRPDLAILTDAVPDLGAVPEGTSVVAGPAFHPVRATVQALHARAPRSPRTRDILITLGGADPGRCTEDLLHVVKEHFADRSVAAVVGPAVARARREHLEASAGGVEVIHDPSNLPELLATSALVVTLGGLTSYEAMCVGTPVAALRWAHMAVVVDRMAAGGLVVPVDLSTAADTLGALLDDRDRLTLLAARGHTLIDGDGARRVAAVVASH